MVGVESKPESLFVLHEEPEFRELLPVMLIMLHVPEEEILLFSEEKQAKPALLEKPKPTGIIVKLDAEN